ncbi:hypothetical protein Tco_0383523 [Tanacetum coccineum]
MPTTPTKIRKFLGLFGYYRRFIESFSRIWKLLTKLTQKNVKYEWEEKKRKPFNCDVETLSCTDFSISQQNRKLRDLITPRIMGFGVSRIYLKELSALGAEWVYQASQTKEN